VCGSIKKIIFAFFRISGMVENLCVFYGDKICNLDGKDYFAFPNIERLAKPDVEGKLRDSKFGYRASFIQKSAEKIVANGGEDWLHSLTKMDYNEAKQSLITLPGIGAKVSWLVKNMSFQELLFIVAQVADCICLMSLGHLQAVPVDTHVFQIATNWYLPHLKKNKTVTTRVYDEVSGHFQGLYGPLAGWAHTV
jgi:N-glycosylase/DNA lyase